MKFAFDSSCAAQCSDQLMVKAALSHNTKISSICLGVATTQEPSIQESCCFGFYHWGKLIQGCLQLFSFALGLPLSKSPECGFVRVRSIPPWSVEVWGFVGLCSLCSFWADMQIVQQATSYPSTQDETFRLYALEVSGNPITQLVPLARLSDLKFQRIFDLVWQDFWIVQLAHLCQGIVAVSAKKEPLFFSPAILFCGTGWNVCCLWDVIGPLHQVLLLQNYDIEKLGCRGRIQQFCCVRASWIMFSCT